MFEESLIESVPSVNGRSRWPAVASIGLQSVLTAVLLAIPIIHPEVLPLAAPRMTVLSPPVLRPVPPPPPPVLMHTSEAASSPSLAPPTLPRRLPTLTVETDAQPVAIPLLAFGTPGPPIAEPLSTVVASGPTASSATGSESGSVGPAAHGPLSISTGVMAGRLLAPIQPVYPPIARIAHTEGSVVIQAIISKAGGIESAHVISGPALLQAAALAAVRDARYRPFLLNNQPTEVETTITINFRLGGGDR